MISPVLVEKLVKRHEDGNPIRVGIAGIGWLGRGLTYQLSRMKGVVPAVLADIFPEKAVQALLTAGYDRKAIVLCDDPLAIDRHLENQQIVVTGNSQFIPQSKHVEIVVDAIGDPNVGAQLSMLSLQKKKHLISSPETDVVIGPFLKQLADKEGVVYSGAEGDEYGVLAGLYRYVHVLGLDIIAVGKCKKYFDRYATPTKMQPFADKMQIHAKMITSYTDGSKLGIEMALVANATGLVPDVRGMHMPFATLEDIPKLFDVKENGGIFTKKGVIDVARGAEPSGAVFVVATTDLPIQQDMQYMKMGGGPNYLFYKPYHLCGVEMPLCLIKAVLENTYTIAPLGGPVADVVAVSKRELQKGEVIGGIGSEHVYGEIDTITQARRWNALPIGIAGGAVMKTSVKQDEVITLDMVELDESQLIVKVWRKQNKLFPSQ